MSNERLPLHQTIGASTERNSRKSFALVVLTSAAIQSSAITTLAVVPLFMTASMPEPASRLALAKFVPASVSPDLPAAPAPVRATPPRRVNVSLTPFREALVRTIDWSVLDEIRIDSGDAFDGLEVPAFDLGRAPGLPGGVGGDVAGRGESRERRLEPGPDPAPVFIGGNVRPPRKILHVSPVYPSIALAARIQGVVALRAVIDVEGDVVKLKVVESAPLLDEAALVAVRQWKYEPTVLNGERVPVIMDVRVAFRLN